MTLNPTRILIAALAAASLALLPGAAQAASKQVVCKDGTKDDGGRGACSGHGGVDKAATSKAAADAKADAKAKKDEAKKEKAAKKAEAKAKKDEAKKETGSKAAKAEETAGAMVTCKDGTASKAGRGACRGHGGVDKGGGGAKAAVPAAPVAPAPAAPAAAPAPAQHSAAPAKADPAKGPPTARCKDGTLSYAEHHTGACSNHGGVAEWMDKK